MSFLRLSAHLLPSRVVQALVKSPRRQKTHPLELSGAKDSKDDISSQFSVLAALLLTTKPKFPASLPVFQMSSTQSPITRFAVRPAPESSICYCRNATGALGDRHWSKRGPILRVWIANPLCLERGKVGHTDGENCNSSRAPLVLCSSNVIPVT